MAFRHKIALCLIATTGLCTSVAGFLAYTQSSRILFKEIQGKVLGIAVTAAELVDGDAHKKIQTRADEDSFHYRRIAAQFRQIRDACQKAGIPVRHIYTRNVSPKDPSVSYFIVDADENENSKSHVGDIYKGQNETRLSLETHQVDSDYVTDKWGVWLSANSPVMDRTGKAVASVGVDLEAGSVRSQIQNIFLWTLLFSAVSIGVAAWFSVKLSQRLTKPLDAIKNAINEIGKGNLKKRVILQSKDEFAEVAKAVNTMAQALEERDRIKDSFSRYVSKDILNQIIGSDEGLNIHGEQKEVTIMFTDIRGFSTFSEKLRPAEVVSTLNEYFEKMIEIVFRHNGTLDKFIGDGMMVVFGAPLEDEKQEENAVKTALEMQKAMVSLQEQWIAHGKQPLRIGIGICTGEAIVGNIGSSQRMEFTAIGDNVNIAARLESMTKELGVNILIADTTYSKLSEEFKTKYIGPINVKGRSQSVVVYSVEEESSTQQEAA